MLYEYLRQDALYTREYLFGGSYHYDYNRLTDSEDFMQFGVRYTKYFDVIELNEDENFIKARGSHLLTPPEPSGAAIIEDAAGVSLPDDVHDYYRQFGEAFLFYIDFYKVLSPTEVVQINSEEHMGTSEKPWRVIRICDLGDCHYVAMLLVDNDWQMVFLPSGETNDSFLSLLDEEPTIVFADSFSNWIQEVCSRKGVHIHVPPGTHSIEGDDVPDSVLLREFKRCT